MFADRVAKLSLEHFWAVVPLQHRTCQPQTCVATIVAHVRKRNATANPPSDDPEESVDELAVVALGVGTKFLTESGTATPKCLRGGLFADTCCSRSFTTFETPVLRVRLDLSWRRQPSDCSNVCRLLMLRTNSTILRRVSGTNCEGM
jgi:hypothetical protein